MCFLSPWDVPDKYRAEYLSHPAITENQDPVLRTDAKIATSLVTEIVGGDMDSALMVPFHYGKTSKGHTGLPPAYLQVAGIDPLRDEALIYERVLREEAGVETRLDLYPFLGHYFWTNFPYLEQSTQFVRDTLEGVRWLLAHSYVQKSS